jgi:transposase
MALEECSMSRKKYQRYTREFKLEAIRLAEESDKPVTQVARELGLRVNQIYKWKQQLEEKQETAFSGQRGREPSEKDKDGEIRRLKKALAESREENEFLKKTALFFARHRP